MTETVTAVAPTVQYATDESPLVENVRPCRSNRRYLEAVSVSAEDGLPIATCEFVIPESCYIDDIGHLDSVEFGILYN